MDRKLELWVIMKLGELKTDRVLTIDDLAEMEGQQPLLIGNIIPLGRIDEPAARRHITKKARARHTRRARRRAARRR